MKKGNTLCGRLRRTTGALALAAALTIGLSSDAFSIISLAESAGKVTATEVRIRKEPDTSSETVASTTQNAKVGVTGQITGSDGYTWYQVSLDAGEVGYIRSDLMQITDGSTPPSVVKATTSENATTASTTATAATADTTTASTAASNATAVKVTATTTTTTSTAIPVAATTTSTQTEATVSVNPVQPVSANVTGNTPVNVRKNASTTSDIVSKANGGLAITVNGTAKGTDGKDWYQVVFISNGSEVNGFIRSDYVKLNGELVAPG